MKKKLVVTTMLTLTMCMSLFTGCNVNKNTQSSTEASTEIAKVKKTMGFDSSDDVLNAFSKIFRDDASKDDVDKCIYIHNKDKDKLLNDIYTNITQLKSKVKFDLNTIKYNSVEMDTTIADNLGYSNADSVYANEILIVGSEDYNDEVIKSLYTFNVYTVSINNRWFITKYNPADDSVVITQNSKIDLTTAKGTLDEPAYLKQFVKTTVKNPKTNEDVDIMVKVTSIATGKKANKYIKTASKENNIEFKELRKGLTYHVFRYAIYCKDPSILTEIPELKFSICNPNDDNGTIDNYKNIDTVWDISKNTIGDFNQTGYWANGICTFAMNDTNKYLIKLTDSNDKSHYFSPDTKYDAATNTNLSTESTQE